MNTENGKAADHYGDYESENQFFVNPFSLVDPRNMIHPTVDNIYLALGFDFLHFSDKRVDRFFCVLK